jgi:hypothetical protein
VRLLLLPCRGHQRPVQKIMGDGLELDVGVEQRNLTVLYVSFAGTQRQTAISPSAIWITVV